MMTIKEKLQRFGRKLLGINGDVSNSGWVTLAGTASGDERLRNSFLEANIRAISTAFCNGEIRLHSSDGEEIPYERKGVNPLLDLLYQPAPFLTENLFKQIISAQLLVYGDVFILKDARNNSGQPTRLIPIPAPSVEIIYDSHTGYPARYQVATTSGSYNVPAEDMMHVYEGVADTLFEGRSRTALCTLDAKTIQAAKTFNLAFFKNGASVGGVVTFPDNVNLSAQQQAEILAFFNDRHQGADKAHRTAILGRGGKYESYKTSHKDMEYAEGQRFSMQQIYSAMGVPPALVGLFEYAPQFNTKEQQKIFYETTVMPMARLLSDAFNEYLVGEFYKEEGVYLDYDFSKVKALEKDWAVLSSAAVQLTTIWPINEVKRALDLPFSDLPGGDEAPDPILNAFGGFSAGKLPHGYKGVSRAEKRALRPNSAQRRFHKKARLRLIEEQSEVMHKSITEHFNTQAEQVRSWIKDNEDKAFSYDEALGGMTAQRNALLALKVPALSEIYKAGILFEQDYLQLLDPTKDYQFLNKKDTYDRVAAWAQQYAFKWADSIERTTWERLDKIVKTGVANGKSNRDINNVILQFFAEEGYEPADLIAEPAGDSVRHISIYDRVGIITQTETRATISEAQLEAYRTTPFVTGKEWITTMGVIDHHEGHLEMDGQIVGVNEKFKNPATGQETEAPGQFGTADQDINCLCDIAPVVEV